ncbi:hypothetical protein Pla175_02020 [Pirellulimonas nuda]|uniref:Uncharacterized protein n=1 Tax=Pirellulimonas nuda TaxID=2528009 RepID=A0A518D5W0_9BACT|nr:hypothetical protein [Pirellulimonas nuda]QDU86849.1 hypothetical protein Pla175_02020 [Pirellulimonas nuda]
MAEAIFVNGGNEATVNAALARAASSIVAISPNQGGYTWSHQIPPVIVAGSFDLSGPVRMPASSRLLAEGAVFKCGSLASTTFAIEGQGWRSEISGSLTIADAPNGVRWNTGDLGNNLTMGSSLISGVHFAGVRGTAVDIQCRSSVVVVERCVFDKVDKIAHSRMCDQLTIRDCFCRPTGTAGVTPITTSWGRLMVDGGIFTPAANARTQASLAWIELEAAGDRQEQMVLVRGARFGGEYGGMAVVLNRCPPRTSFPSAPGVSITLRDVHASNTPSADEYAADPPIGAPLVLLAELPNSLVIDGCIGMVRPKHLVDFLPWVDGPALAAGMSATGLNNRCILQLQRGATITPGEEAPEVLRPFVVGPAAQPVGPARPLPAQ